LLRENANWSQQLDLAPEFESPIHYSPWVLLHKADTAILDPIHGYFAEIFGNKHPTNLETGTLKKDINSTLATPRWIVGQTADRSAIHGFSHHHLATRRCKGCLAIHVSSSCI
jgi:hypothetical protein